MWFGWALAVLMNLLYNCKRKGGGTVGEHLDERGKIFWHEAFYEALQLELHEYMDLLKFDNEYRLSEEALRMDVLVIKKNKDAKIEKNIGNLFKGHNIFEYKSELDSFSLWDYNKILGYALLYSSFEKVPLSDITVSISLTMYPRELVRNLENERGFKVNELGDGIYYVDGDIVPIQILESKNLSPESNVFLRNLRSNLSTNEMLKTLQSYKEYKLLDDKNIYLDRLVKANADVFLEVMDMSESVKEIFLEGAERYGWLDDKFTEHSKQIAKQLLLLGVSVEKISEATGLSVEAVMDLI